MHAIRHALGLAVFIASTASAQVPFGGSYQQDFDGLAQSGAVTLSGRGPHAIEGVLGSTGVEGWTGANLLGSSENTEFKAHDGSLASGAGRGVIFFGSNGMSDRALGALPTSNQISSFGVVLLNVSTETYAAVQIAFTGEQWRAGTANVPNVLAFSYGFGDALEAATTPFGALDFATPFLDGGEVAVDGNNAAFQTPIAATIRGIAWAPGQTIVLRWDIAEFSGQDNGLGIDDLSVVGTPGITSFDLADYELSGTHPLPPIAAAEASAITWNWDSATLFVLGDEGEAIVEVTTTGVEVSQMTLAGFDDTEGLTYIGDGQFVIVEERLQDLYLLTYVAGGSANRGDLPTVSLGPTVGNVGLEGVSFDPIADVYITVKEKTPQAVAEATIDWSVPSGLSTDLFIPMLGVADLSDVQVLTTVPTLLGTADEDGLLIYSQESALLMEVSRTGELLSTFSFSGIASDAEGVTIDAEGTIYVVGETPELYVLTPKRTSCAADLDGNSIVDGADLGLLLGAWGGPGAGDLDESGSVDGADIGLLLGAWGDC